MANQVNGNMRKKVSITISHDLVVVWILCREGMVWRLKSARFCGSTLPTISKATNANLELKKAAPMDRYLPKGVDPFSPQALKNL